MKRILIVAAFSALTLIVVTDAQAQSIEKNPINKFENAKAVIAPYVAVKPAMVLKAFEFETPNFQGVTSLGIVYSVFEVKTLTMPNGFEFGIWKVKPPALVGSSSE